MKKITFFRWERYANFLTSASEKTHLFLEEAERKLQVQGSRRSKNGSPDSRDDLSSGEHNAAIGVFVQPLSFKKSLLFWLIIVFLVQLPVTAQSQAGEYSFKFINTELHKVLTDIEKKANYHFVFRNEDIDINQRVTLVEESKDLKYILRQLFDSLNIKWETTNNEYILLKPKEKKKIADKNEIEITGKVVDENNVPLIGVNVFVEGTSEGTVTNLDGNYKINVDSDDAVLVFSFVGYLTEKVPLTGQTVIDVQLLPDITKLDEVVVVGYGKQRKLTTVGSQSTMTAKEIQMQPVANITNAISGRIAGIVAVQRSGEPGYDNSEIYIRGISTFTGSNPLILVDGIERSFNNVSPEDIASFTILKDASATAVYGVRGANGVILIETKKGRQGKPIITFDYNQGLTQFTRTPELADGVTYLKMANEAYKNSNPNQEVPLYSDEKIEKTADGSDPDLYPNVDWFDEIFNKYGNNRRATLNASGGSESAIYYLSLGYYDETGLFKTDELAKYNSTLKFTRYNFTSNLSLDLFKYTNVSFGASGWISNGNYPGVSTGGIWSSAYLMPPTVVPVKYSTGEFAQTRAGDVYNPYVQLTQSGYSNELRNQLWSNIKLTQSLDPVIKGLSVYGTFSFDAYNDHTIRRTKSVDTYLATGRDEDNSLILEQTSIGSNYLGYDRSNGGNRQFYIETGVNYQRKFGDNEVTGMLIYNQSDKVDAFSGDFISSIPRRYQGIASRVTYSYKDKYNAEFNLGYNGSEVFAPGKRFGFFPSYGISWVASNESFFEPISGYIQFLKIRGSYGIAGSSDIGGRRFAYIATVAGDNGYHYGRDTDIDIGGLAIGDYAVNVTWEKAQKSNIGFEIKTWHEAFSLTVDVFKEIRTGIYRTRGDLPSYQGILRAPEGNLGEIHNRGIEGTTVLNKRLGRHWIVDFRGNLTWNRAIIVENANAPWPYPWQQRIGRKYGQRFGKIAIGLFESEEEIANSPYQSGDIKPGDIKYKDLNGDGKIDSYDEGPIGSGSIPEIVYGFGPSISYKGFGIGAWFKGISNVDISIGDEGLQPFQKEGVRGNLFSNITDRWTPENPSQDVTYPRLTYPSTTNSNYDNSSWWVKNGAFLRLQNIEVSYNFRNNKWFDKVGVTNFRIYGIGYNILTFSEFKMWDVELGDGRGGSYPLLKSFNLGVECQF